MEEHKCDNCGKGLNRHMFCDNVCKVRFHRKGNVTKSNDTEGNKLPSKEEIVTKRNKKVEFCKKHGSLTHTCGC